MAKQKEQLDTTKFIVKPTQILLDETFLMCASGQGCDAKDNNCKDEPDERKRRALTAMLMAQETKVFLVLDDSEPSQIASFYHRKRAQLSRDVGEILSEWLNKRTARHRPAKLKQNIIDECNLKPGTLDPLLCQLAIACYGDAPIWTLDSDFWCASQFHPQVRPACPGEALASVR